MTLNFNFNFYSWVYIYIYQSTTGGWIKYWLALKTKIIKKNQSVIQKLYDFSQYCERVIV